MQTQPNMSCNFRINMGSLMRVRGQTPISPPTLVLAVLPSRFIDKVISQMGPL